MKRIVLLMFLALALPLAAFGDSINFNDLGSLGTGGNSTATGTIKNGGSYTLNVPLTLFTDNGVTLATSGTVTIDTGTLSSIGGGQYTFTGQVTVVNSSSALLFQSAIASGMVTVSKGTIKIEGALPGGNVLNSIAALVNHQRSVSGNGNAVTTPVVPEPGTLGLLGTGLVGIAGLVRRKVKTRT